MLDGIFGDLIKDVDLIVGVYRCPWLTFEHNPECYHVLIDDLHDWWDQFIHSGEGYGLDNLLSFVTPLPEDKKHMVCSMATTLALIDCVNSDPRFPCNFPKDWIVAGKDNVPMVGLVSPLDQLKWFNQAGWGVWQDPAINKV